MTDPKPEGLPATTFVEKAGAIPGISRGLAYQGVNGGSIYALHVGRRWRVPTAQLRALLEGGPSPPEKDEDPAATGSPSRAPLECLPFGGSDAQRRE